MAIDLDRCTVCRACIVACKVENNHPVSSPEDARQGRCINWLELVVEQAEAGLAYHQTYLPRPCMQCDKPPCVKVCPVYATYQAEEGLVGQIYPRCIGCRYCMNNCPYNVKKFNWFEPKWPEGLDKARNPDVSVRPRGVVEKCTFCHHRWQREKEQARMEGRPPDKRAYQPACVEACPATAIIFGDVDDPTDAVTVASSASRAFRLLEEMGTEPKVWYLRETRG
jgi:molybdopterin-containing oxidoreductase family iron-sulfur binding subunit